MRMRMWQFEMLLVAIVLACTVVLSGGAWLEWVGAAAVLASFGHAQVADRMAEKQALEHRFAKVMTGGESRGLVRCYRWSLRYFYAKELLWLGYFVAHRSWSAVVGVAVFLAYPLWRRAYRHGVYFDFDNGGGNA